MIRGLYFSGVLGNILIFFFLLNLTYYYNTEDNGQKINIPRVKISPWDWLISPLIRITPSIY